MKIALSVLALAGALAFAAPPAFALDSCADQASAKKLAGAAKDSFVKKCIKDATEVCDKEAAGKKLAGAAKSSFTGKCVKDASGG